ncbi:hypothetical protein AJ80_07467 [Polytolypa hystricis UAMH7299]|uniref:Uncharacterized protein n=1 Tax=Polytolypa hystricis (strain UAMH7299) TaxID=1447883 RepID=A0A2B7XN80_POLH7|nr:hypothetical protein AJ80_07467 [Polytolypa hystricis UAMH7299]
MDPTGTGSDGPCRPFWFKAQKEPKDQSPSEPVSGGQAGIDVIDPSDNTSTTAIAPQAATNLVAAELPARLHPRPSRASSIVSTMTTSTFTSLQEDSRSVRSIDIRLGGKVFHINRDASRISITDQTGLPPYSPPQYPSPSPLTQNYSQLPELNTPIGDASDHLESPDLYSLFQEPSTPSASHHMGQSASQEQKLTTPKSRFDLTTSPGNPATTSNSTSGTNEEATVWRSPSFNPGPERLSVVPKRRSVSQSNITDHLRCGGKNINPRLRRRNGIRLPKLFTDVTDGRFGENSLAGVFELEGSPSTGKITHSAGPSFGRDDQPYSPSSAFIGQTATGRFPAAESTTISPAERAGPKLFTITPKYPSLVVAQSPAEVEEGHVETEMPPAMDTANDISIHYTRLIRSIDRDHRKALHERDKELAAMRERLNEVDQVYRQELKSRDFTIEDLRVRLDNLQEQMAMHIEKAQNEVEDLWESRWKDRDRHLMERMRRMELDSQKHVERAVAERDEEWADEWASRNSQLLDRLKAAEKAAEASALFS